MSKREQVYKTALAGKKIPILTLDHKWHKLFSQTGISKEMKHLVEELNALLKRQGKLNDEIKEIQKLKSRLMDEIVSLMPEADKAPDKKTEKKLDDNRRLIQECNDKLDEYKDELLDLPKEVDAINYELMLASMEVCYEKIHDNYDEIEKIAQWINEIRVQLKKNVIRKQQKEVNNQMLYAYMHDIFGAEVMEIFDMHLKPEETKVLRKIPKSEIKDGKKPEEA